MRVGCPHARSLQPRRVVLLSQHLLVLHATPRHSFDSWLLHNVPLHVVAVIWVFNAVLVVGPVGEGSTDSLVLHHLLVHVAWIGYGAAALSSRTTHRILVHSCATVLVPAHILVENNVTVCLVRVFLKHKFSYNNQRLQKPYLGKSTYLGRDAPRHQHLRWSILLLAKGARHPLHIRLAAVRLDVYCQLMTVHYLLVLAR